MIKKFICLALLGCFFSCSTDELQLRDDDVHIKNVAKTVSPPYFSPFDGPVNSKTYTFSNNTDYITEFTAHLGVAYFDGVDDGTHFSIPMANAPGTILFSGFSMSTEYLNTIKTLPFEVNPFSGYVIDAGHCAVSTSFSSAMNYFLVPVVSVPQYDGHILYEYGKPYLIDYKIKDVLGAVLSQGTIKIRFVDDSYDHTTNPEWVDLGNYTKTNEQILYHHDTHEIVIANSSAGTPSINYINLNGEDYYVEAFTTATEIKIIFDRLN